MDFFSFCLFHIEFQEGCIRTGLVEINGQPLLGYDAITDEIATHIDFSILFIKFDYYCNHPEKTKSFSIETWFKTWKWISKNV